VKKVKKNPAPNPTFPPPAQQPLRPAPSVQVVLNETTRMQAMLELALGMAALANALDKAPHLSINNCEFNGIAEGGTGIHFTQQT
jgi:hypothetical protein